MTANRRNNGRANAFTKYNLAELEHFARDSYGRLETDATPGSYWLLDECLRQLEKKKGSRLGIVLTT